MSFASEPGREDGNLPPVNIVIPDDARELDRDVLAYHREQRARRRRQRFVRLFGPFGRREYGGHAAILPLIATCVALSMLAGAMLSVITISPASAPTVPPSPVAAGLSGLPSGTVWLNDKTPKPMSTMRNSVVALVPPYCQCGPALSDLAQQAALAHVRLYFVASGAAAAPQLASLTSINGHGIAIAAYDRAGRLEAAYLPVGLTELLVFRDGTVKMITGSPAGAPLGSDLRELTHPAAGTS